VSRFIAEHQPEYQLCRGIARQQAAESLQRSIQIALQNKLNF
jgi:hypothetical protein